ncbi:MAG: ECF transporter S component [archaeon]
MRSATRMKNPQAKALQASNKAEQRLACHALSKHIQLIELKEWLLMGGFAVGGALLRVPMQAIPSAEPITFFAILTGVLLGPWRGIAVGVSSLYLSNFMVMGGQGPWTLFQAIGFGAAGLFGGMLRKRPGVLSSMLVAVVATVVFEIVMNLSSVFLFPHGLLGIFLTAIPFSMVHILSNTAFAALIPSAVKLTRKTGNLDEKEIAKVALARLESKTGKITVVTGPMRGALSKVRSWMERKGH